jgi:predicted ATPase
VLVSSAVSQAMGLRTTGDRSLLETLLARLQDKRLLLVLDNFEHVLKAAPEMASLTSSCSNLTYSQPAGRPCGCGARSATPFRLSGFPDSTRATDVKEAPRAPSVELFVDRVRKNSLDFELTQANAAAVARICRRLEGLPLALELAAAKVELLVPSAAIRISYSLQRLVGSLTPPT